jgi:hypothetical protein
MPDSVRSSVRGVIASLTLIVGAASAAAAQSTTAIEQPPNTKELGIDAGAVFGLGSQSSVQIDVPAARARIGYFLRNDSRWSVEPAIGLSYIKVEDADGALLYNLEAGALYHFRPPTDVMERVDAARRVRVAYARPFVNLTGITGDGGDSEFSAGAGLGVKVPWQSSIAFRLEANLGYGFDNEALRLGAFAGLSFFTR